MSKCTVSIASTASTMSRKATRASRRRIARATGWSNKESTARQFQFKRVTGETTIRTHHRTTIRIQCRPRKDSTLTKPRQMTAIHHRNSADIRLMHTSRGKRRRRRTAWNATKKAIWPWSVQVRATTSTATTKSITLIRKQRANSVWRKRMLSSRPAAPTRTGSAQSSDSTPTLRLNFKQ